MTETAERESRAEEIRLAVEQVSRALATSDHKPGADQAATARLTGGLGVEVTGPSGQRMRTDMPTAMGGAAAAPGPGWMLRASIASCLASMIAVRAASLGVSLERLEVTVDSLSDSRGMFGVGPKVTAGFLELITTVRIAAANAGEDQLREIVRWADEHSPVSATLRTPPQSRVIVEVG